MDVLITSDAAKLPPDIAQLQDDSRPLPVGVQFFEEKFTFAGLVKQLLWALLFLAVGIIVFLVSVILMFTPDRNSTVYSSTSMVFLTGAVIGLVFAIGGWIFLKSLWPKYRLMRGQSSGRTTRYGIFLTGDLLISRSFEDTTVIPKPSFKGVKNGAVQYDLKGQDKSFNLPDTATAGALEAAIARWAA
jgi:hypothetical protein